MSKASKVCGKFIAKKASVNVVPSRKTTMKARQKSGVARVQKPTSNKIEDSSLTAEQTTARLLKELLPGVLKDLLKPASLGCNPLETTQSQTQSTSAEAQLNIATQPSREFGVLSNLSHVQQNQATDENEKSNSIRKEVAATSVSSQENSQVAQPNFDVPIDYSLASKISDHASLMPDENTLRNGRSTIYAGTYNRSAYVPIRLQQEPARSPHLRSEVPEPSVPESNIVPLQEQGQQRTELLASSGGPLGDLPSPMPMPRQQHYAAVSQHRIVQSYVPFPQQGAFQRYSSHTNIPESRQTANVGPPAGNRSLMWMNVQHQSYQPTNFQIEPMTSQQENYPTEQTETPSVSDTTLNWSDEAQLHNDRKQRNRARNAKRRQKQYENMIGIAKEELMQELQARPVTSNLNIPRGLYPQPTLDPRVPMYPPGPMQNFSNAPYGFPSWFPPGPSP